MKTLKDKVIVITGASSGIGEAMAREYAARGAKVVLGAQRAEVAALAGEIRRHGGQAAYCGVDVTRPEECRGLIDTAVREFGGWTYSSAMRAFRCARSSTTWSWRCCTV